MSMHTLARQSVAPRMLYKKTDAAFPIWSLHPIFAAPNLCSQIPRSQGPGPIGKNRINHLPFKGNKKQSGK